MRDSSFRESRVARKLWFCGGSPCSAASRERLTPVFNYRFVGFGTTFEHRDGIRPVAGNDVPPFALYENEIAVDVGGRCFGCEGYDLPVLDHHALPAARLELCATAAVLHHATALQRRFAYLSQDRIVWLVTHRDGDFDAFASMYLVRWLLSGAELGDGWDAAMERVDWYDPALGELAPGIRWAVTLASYAARIDNAKRILVSREHALHSVLYAALARKRPYLDESSGACELFDEARARMETGLDPTYDCVLSPGGTFAPEFALLSREGAAYERDLKRARRAIVFVPDARAPFDEAYARVSNVPLLDAAGAIEAPQLEIMDAVRRPFDGIYIQEPECLLFKEWARGDVDNSSMHAGFAFTFVAYAGDRDNAVNATDYFIALDPESSGSANLYPLWARLQREEVRAAHARDSSASPNASVRRGFEARAGNDATAFADPWFDAPNYACKLVATPYGGTFIGGAAAGLSSDPIAEIVRVELEGNLYVEELRARDYPGREGGASPDWFVVDPRVGEAASAPQSAYFRWASVRLREGTDVFNPLLADQISATLWSVLHPDDVGRGPQSPVRETFRQGGMLAVWSRRGVAVAYEARARERVETLAVLFAEIVSIARRIDGLVDGLAADQTDGVDARAAVARTRERVEQSEAIVRSMTAARHELFLPEGRVIANFVSEVGFDDLLATLHELSAGKKLDDQNDQLSGHMQVVADVQTKVEWLELFFVATYATELTHVIAEDAMPGYLRLAFTTVSSTLLSGVAAMFLRPWKRDRDGLALVVAAVVVLGLGFALGATQIAAHYCDRPSLVSAGRPGWCRATDFEKSFGNE